MKQLKLLRSSVPKELRKRGGRTFDGQRREEKREEEQGEGNQTVWKFDQHGTVRYIVECNG